MQVSRYLNSFFGSQADIFPTSTGILIFQGTEHFASRPNQISFPSLRQACFYPPKIKTKCGPQASQFHKAWSVACHYKDYLAAQTVPVRVI